MPPENNYIQIEGPKCDRLDMPLTTDHIKDGDPHAYLDEEDCIIWVGEEGDVHYMNPEGGVGTVCQPYEIIRRLGVFKGISIQRTGGQCD